MKNILLINPAYQKETRWVTDDRGPGSVAMHDMPPLGLATVAGFTPDEYHVDIWDETIHGRIDDTTEFKTHYDLVGLTSHILSLPRCREISAIFRKRSILVTIGGPGVSSTPYSCKDDFDILFIGEAEETWSRFLLDLKSNTCKSEYRQINKPDLSDIPAPDWCNLVDDFGQYVMGCVQTTRGCPYDCEFCDVIYLFGRRLRHKPVNRILEEVKVLEQLGVSSIFFSDDEFVGDSRYAKKLLHALIPLNNSFARPLTFATQVSMNVGRDEDLLRLLADANFNLLIIGIETPNKESLKEVGKFHNVRRDLVADVHRIVSFGIPIRSGIMVGFDHDDLTIFDMQYEFIQKTCLASVSLNMLKAAMGTRLWLRLRREERVLDISEIMGKSHSRVNTNIVPKKMTRIELMKGFSDLLERVHTWESFSERIRGFVSLVQYQRNVTEPLVSEEELIRLPASLGVGPEGKRTIDEIISHTKTVAPFLLRRVKGLITQYARYRPTVTDLLTQLDQSIEMESSGEIRLKPDMRPIVIPISFRKSYSKIFPEIYNRTNRNLVDKSKTSEALIEVLVDFLIRWGGEFENIEEHHLVFLQELCDRSCAKFNDSSPENELIDKLEEEASSSIKGIYHIGEDVLKAVDQEMFARNSSAA